MSAFHETDIAAAALIATAASRKTDEAVMRAIAFHANSEAEGVEIWENGPRSEPEALAIWDTATGNGRDGDGTDMSWGDNTLADMLEAG